MIEFGFAIEPKGESPSLINQTHGKDVVLFTHKASPPVTADALWTHLPNLEIYVFTADCLSVLLHGEQVDPIAAIHCGWRGALSGVVTNTRSAVGGEIHTAVLGPSIHACCFEVRTDFIKAFRRAGLDIAECLHLRNDKYYFDLPRWVIRTQLVGISKIVQDPRCTRCHSDALPSFRRSHQTDPRIRAWIRNVSTP